MELASLFLIVLISSIAQSSTGFGFSILSMPFLLLIYQAHEAVWINLLLSLLLSAITTVRTRKEIDKKLLIRLVKGSFIGFVPGLLLFMFLDVKPLKLVIIVMILLFSILLLFNIKVKRSPEKSIFVGSLSGFLSSSIGIPGPPLLVYFNGTKMDMQVIRSTTLSFYILAFTVSLLLHISFSGFPKTVLLHSVYSLPFLLLGMVLGEKFFRSLTDKTFHRVLYFVLLSTGVGLVFSLF